MPEDQDPDDILAEEAAELDGYFSDAPLNPKPDYPPLKKTFENAVIITNLPKVPEKKLGGGSEGREIEERVATLTKQTESDAVCPAEGKDQQEAETRTREKVKGQRMN